MSYILDALKKSEAERRLGQVPRPTETYATPGAPGRRRLLPWLLGLLLVFNGALVALLLADRQDIPFLAGIPLGKPAAEPGPVPKAAGEGAPPALPVQARTAPPAASGQGTTEPGRADEAAPSELSRQRARSPETGAAATETPEPVVDSPVVEELIREELAAQARRNTRVAGSAAPPGRAREPAPSQVVEDPAGSAETGPVAETGAAAGEPVDPGPQPPLLESLPSSFRQQLPELRINVYVYADRPQDRFVMINMRKYREGASIGEGLRLESIGRESLTLAFEGTRFRLAR